MRGGSGGRARGLGCGSKGRQRQRGELWWGMDPEVGVKRQRLSDNYDWQSSIGLLRAGRGSAEREKAERGMVEGQSRMYRGECCWVQAVVLSFLALQSEQLGRSLSLSSPLSPSLFLPLSLHLSFSPLCLMELL